MKALVTEIDSTGPTGERFLSTRETCKEMYCSQATLYLRISKGLMVPGIKFSGTVKGSRNFPPSELALLKAGRTANKSEEETKALVSALMAKRQERFNSLAEQHAIAA